MSRRLSLCYAAPGSALLSTTGPTRNILSLVEALSAWTDVTVAFRTLREPFATETFQVIAIEPQGAGGGSRRDDVAARGLNPFSHLAYLNVLRHFARQWAGSFDVVLEKGWRLSGCLAVAFRAHGVPGVLVENDVRNWHEPLRDVHTIVRYGLHLASHRVATYASRRMPAVIAETDELKTMLMQQRGIAQERVDVIGLAVDHRLFRPQDRDSARQALGIRPDACVMLYVGSLDANHDLAPMLEACVRTPVPDLEVHVVGDGEYRRRYEAIAGPSRLPVCFHGYKPHPMVPMYIAASDVCLAPYQVNAFHNRLVAFSTLKIPEYMACARPVISVPSGHIRDLITEQVTGFLVPNEVPDWGTFLHHFPGRSRLRTMGCAAARAVASVSWEHTAAQYLEVSRRLVACASMP